MKYISHSKTVEMKVLITTTLVLVSLHMLVVEGSLRADMTRRMKRQQNACADFGDLPADCLSFIDSVALENIASYITNVCLGDCGQEIYDFYTKCDSVTGENNAAVLDFFCATSTIDDATGTQCVSTVSTILALETTLEKQCPFLSSPEITCSPTCGAAINSHNRALGCCLYTYYGLVVGTDYADYLFNSCSADIAVCDGGFSNQSIPLPAATAGSGGVIYGGSNCPNLSIDQIPVECRDFIQFHLIELYAYSEPEDFVSTFCTGVCAKPLYDYFKQCDKVSMNSTAPTLDFLCTSDPSGMECARFISNTTALNDVCAGADESDSCPTGCSTTLKQINTDFGCCLYTYIALLLNTMKADEILHNKCDINSPGLCQVGALSGEIIDTRGREADDSSDGNNNCPDISIDQIPDTCRDFIQFYLIELYAYSEPEEFLLSFCTGLCAKPLYDYFKQCDKVSMNSTAPTLDFLCTSDHSGMECARFISGSNTSVDNTLNGVCTGVVESDFCPAGCSATLKEINTDFGCCLYTYISLLLNTMEADKILRDKCDIDTPGLCQRGVLSGNSTDSPGVEDNGDDRSSASAMKSFAILMFGTLLLGTFP